MLITSEQNPRVKRVVKLREAKHRRRMGRLLAEGDREITRAVAAGLWIEELWWCPQRQPVLHEAWAEAAGSVLEVPDPLLRKLTYLREPEGVLAVCKPPRWNADELSDGLWLVAVGTEKPGNLGAMVRSAAAFGAAAVIAAGRTVDVFHPNAIRASTAAVFSMPTLSMTEKEAKSLLEQRGAAVYAATLERGRPLPEVKWPGKERPVAVVIGPEDVGLEGLWIDLAECSGGGGVTIPMAAEGGGVDSLNASVAAGILLYTVVDRGR